MTKEAIFTPMNEAQTRRLRTTAEFPFKTHEQIGLNIPQLQRLCQISGFRTLRIENQPDPLTSKSEINIVGMGKNGEALGGRSSMSTVPTSEFQLNERESTSNNPKARRWKDLTISLNAEEIQQRLLFTKKDVRKAELWAKELNQALVQGIVRAGVKNLVTDLKFYDLLSPVILYPIYILPHLDRIGSNFLLGGVIFNMIGSLLGGFENLTEGSNNRYSVIIGPELDRAAVLLGLAYTQKLAKKIP